jgi:general secretion pathway protein A
MYNAHFGFREAPFGVTPDPQFYYSNPVYQEAWATLHYGIEARKGFILITGEAGTGKTTLLRKAMHAFGSTIKTAYIPNTLVGYTDLLRLMLTDLGLPVTTDNRSAMIKRLTDYLIEQFEAGNIVALLIDEAQNLRLETLEELRLLGNLETDKDKLLQIVLVGQPELEQKLDQPELRQLKQRIVLRCQLKPVAREEVGSYIDSRLRTIGHRSEDLFDPDAVEKVALYSSGIPRLINIICDNALLAAFALSKRKISAAIVDEVADDLHLAHSQMPQTVHTDLPMSPHELDKTPKFATAPDNAPVVTEELPCNDSGNPPSDAPKDFLAPVRHTHPSFRRIIGTSAAIVLLVGFGVRFYANEPGTSNSRSNSDTAVSGANEQNKINLVDSTASRLVARTSTIAPLPTFPAGQMQPMDVADQNVSTTPLEKASAPAAAEAKIQQNSIAVANVPDDQKAKTPARSDNDENNSTNGVDFLVVGSSFVRAKPTANAAIIATLKPGTHITVAGRTGEYFRIHSLGAETIRGYVHKEDAFFERHS